MSQDAERRAWLRGLPAVCQRLASRFPPMCLVIPAPGHSFLVPRVSGRVIGYSENGCLLVVEAVAKNAARADDGEAFRGHCAPEGLILVGWTEGLAPEDIKNLLLPLN